VLEEYLENYKGCLIVVTHDRYFMDKIVDHLFVFEGEGKVNDILGSYSVWREKQKQEQYKLSNKKSNTPKPVANEEPITADKADKKSKTTLTYKEKLELEALELEMELLEAKKTELETALGGDNQESKFILETSTQLSEALTSLETKTDRWLKLSEYT
jgi:ABC transport system ATP-binding/permease protein